MASFHNRRRRKRDDAPASAPKRPELLDLADPGRTSSESAYLKSLVESRKTVTVVFKTGARLRGRIRYFDRDCLSLGPIGRGPNVFLRKDSVAYIAEEKE